MSKQFFGFVSDEDRQPKLQQLQQEQQQYDHTSENFANKLGAASQQVSQRLNLNYQNHNQRRPHRQGYYASPNHDGHHVQQQVPHLPYNGLPPIYGQQQGFGQRQSNQNETRTDGYPPDNAKHYHPYQVQHRQQVLHYPPVEYQHQYHQVVEYPKAPETAGEYQTSHDYHNPQLDEYHHLQPQTHIVEEHHAPAIGIHSGHHHHEPPTHIQYYHPHQVKHHHYPTHKPKRFHLSVQQTPDLKIIDNHLKIPPIKFRLHVTPKVVISSNTKDPLEKKPEDDEHDLEPYPPPDAFSDPDGPPSLSQHIIEHYAPKHKYPVHQPVNPHRSLGHYEPTFKVIQKAIIITPPPPTPPTTTTTARTTTTTQAITTTPSPRRARISGRNPAFTVAFTESATSSTTAATAAVSPSTTTDHTTFREVENDGIARRDELPTISEFPQPTVTKLTSTTTSTTTLKSTSSITTREPTTTTTATTRTSPTSIPTTSTATTQPSTSTSINTAKPQEGRSRVTPPEETTPHTTTLDVDSNEIDMRRNTEAPRQRPEPLQEELSSVESPEFFNLEGSESVKVIETNMLIDGKNQTVRFYYITQPVKFPLPVFQKMTGQGYSGVNVVKIRD